MVTGHKSPNTPSGHAEQRHGFEARRLSKQNRHSERHTHTHIWGDKQALTKVPSARFLSGRPDSHRKVMTVGGRRLSVSATIEGEPQPVFCRPGPRKRRHSALPCQSACTKGTRQLPPTPSQPPTSAPHGSSLWYLPLPNAPLPPNKHRGPRIQQIKTNRGTKSGKVGEIGP